MNVCAISGDVIKYQVYHDTEKPIIRVLLSVGLRMRSFDDRLLVTHVPCLIVHPTQSILDQFEKHGTKLHLEGRGIVAPLLNGGEIDGRGTLSVALDPLTVVLMPMEG